MYERQNHALAALAYGIKICFQMCPLLAYFDRLV